MAGTLVANQINTDTGLFSTNNAYSGIAKAWVNFGVSGSTVTINNSFNVSSVTRSSTGRYNLTFTTAQPNANYVVLPSGAPQTDIVFYGISALASVYGSNSTTTAYFTYINNSAGQLGDPLIGWVAVLGS